MNRNGPVLYHFWISFKCCIAALIPASLPRKYGFHAAFLIQLALAVFSTFSPAKDYVCSRTSRGLRKKTPRRHGRRNPPTTRMWSQIFRHLLKIFITSDVSKKKHIKERGLLRWQRVSHTHSCNPLLRVPVATSWLLPFISVNILGRERWILVCFR